LEKKVSEFTGTSKNKEYVVLDELLTRNLIKLDNIETEGREDVRNARKACIRLIQKCINDLEEKIAKKPSDKKAEEPSTPSTALAVRTPPATKTEKPNFTPARKASSEPPYHRSEISIVVNQDEKEKAPPASSDEDKPKPTNEKDEPKQ
jgi:hypothetical protein